MITKLQKDGNTNLKINFFSSTFYINKKQNVKYIIKNKVVNEKT